MPLKINAGKVAAGRASPAPSRPTRRPALRWPLVLALLITACVPASSSDTEFERAGEKALDWTRQLVELGPRPSGSEANRRAQRLIVGGLRGQQAEIVEAKFTAQTPNGPVAMNNIIGKFAGRSGKVIVVSGHYDTYSRPGLHFVGANDGGSSAGFLLALAGLIHERKLADEIWLVFFDGEESVVRWEGDDNTYGSRHLAAKWRADGTAARIKALINVDMIGDADLGLVYEQNSTPWLRERVWGVAERLGYQKQFPKDASGYIEDDHMPFLAAGVSAVDLIDLQYGFFNRYWHTDEDTLDKLSAGSFAIILHVVTETLEELGGSQ